MNKGTPIGGTKRRLLVTGASGMLGGYLCRLARTAWRVWGTVHSHPVDIPGVAVLRVDLTDGAAVDRLFRTVSPDAVVHAAALSNPNFCETDPAASRRINLEAAADQARRCADRGIPFVFTSTDLVFDGERAPYRASDPVSPICVYGKHKAEAEVRIRDRHPDAAICRMPLMFGTSAVAPNFFEAGIAALTSGAPLHLFTDEYRTPMGGREAAGLLLDIAARGRGGVFHLGGPQKLSRYDFGLLTARLLGADPGVIVPCRQSDRPMAAARPRDVSLDSQWTYSKLETFPPPLAVQIRQLLHMTGEKRTAATASSRPANGDGGGKSPARPLSPH